VTRVRYLAPARLELNSAARRYRDVAQGLADEFEEEYLRAVGLIEEHPLGSPVVEAPVRRKVLRKFPYSILYRVVGDAIEVVAVMHHKQRPGYWLGRMPHQG